MWHVVRLYYTFLALLFLNACYLNSSVVSANKSSDSNRDRPEIDKFEIELGASSTTKKTVSIQVTASSAAEMYLTLTPNCVSGGEWKTFTTNLNDIELYNLNGINKFYLKVRSLVGNESECREAEITHVLTLKPISNITGEEADISLTNSPVFTFTTADADNTFPLADVEYSIGTTNGDTNIKSWTSLGTAASTLQVTSLSLSIGNSYFLNFRVKDSKGNYSAISSGSWRVVNSVSVSPRYSSASNWNDYVKKSATSSACQTSDTFFYNCIHGGEKKEIVVTGENSCNGMTAYDSLGVFDWVCEDGTPVKMVSIEVKIGKGLKDLLNPTSWKTNKVIVKKSGMPIAASAASTWWTNTISVLPDSTAAQITLSGTSTIYTISAPKLTRGYYINADKISIVTLGNSSLSLDPSGSPNATNTGIPGSTYYTMFINGTRMHTWLEGHFKGGFYSNAVNGYFTYGGFQYFNVINNARIEDFYYGQGFSSKTLLKSVIGIRNRNFKYGTDGFYNIVRDSSFGGEYEFNSSSSTSSHYINNYFAKAKGVSGLSIASHTDSNVLFSTTDTGIDVQLTTRVTFHSTLAPNGYTYNSNSTALTMSDFLSSVITTIHAATSFKISGLFGFQSCSATAFTGTGITSSCGMAGSSNAATVSPIDVLHSTGGGQSLVGFITSDSNHPNYDSAQGLAYSNITNWTQFDRPSRFWVDDNRGFCESGKTCFIYDYALSTHDGVVLNKSGNLTTSNDSFPTNPSDNCPAQVHGNQIIIDQKTSPQTFLKNAMEIMGDVIGDDDGLCESNESCIYTPNIGAYQGHGDFTTRTCTFQNGTVTGVKIYAYPYNGYSN